MSLLKVLQDEFVSAELLVVLSEGKGALLNVFRVRLLSTQLPFVETVGLLLAEAQPVHSPLPQGAEVVGGRRQD